MRLKAVNYNMLLFSKNQSNLLSLMNCRVIPRSHIRQPMTIVRW